MRTRLTCIGCWKFPFFFFFSYIFSVFWTAIIKQDKQTSSWVYLCKMVGISMKQSNLSPLGYKQVEKHWNVWLAPFLMQQIDFHYLLVFFWHWNLWVDNLIDLPRHFKQEFCNYASHTAVMPSRFPQEVFALVTDRVLWGIPRCLGFLFCFSFSDLWYQWDCFVRTAILSSIVVQDEY